MTKLFLLLLISTSCFAQLSRAKIQYFIDLSDMKGVWEQSVKIKTDQLVISSPRLKLVRRELDNYISTNAKWSSVKRELIKHIENNYNEDELNKLIAIYELGVMKKMMKDQKLMLTTGLGSLDKIFEEDNPELKKIYQLSLKKLRQRKAGH